MLHLTEHSRLVAEAAERKHLADIADDTEGYIQAKADLVTLKALPPDHEHRQMICRCGQQFIGEHIVLGVLSMNHVQADGTAETVFQTAPEYVRHYVIGPCCIGKEDTKGHLFSR